nr:carboxymuconolactone decarboxylase family protein [Bacillus subtilis]
MFYSVTFGQERKNFHRGIARVITVSALIAGGNVEQLTPHLHKAKENGLTKEKIAEIITHLSFYAGWYLKLGQHFKSQKRSLHMKRKKDN